MKVNSLGFRTDLMLRRMAGSLITAHPSHLVVRTPANPGYWWGNFVLFDAPPRQGDGARWSSVFSGEFPDAAHLALGVDGTDGDAGDASERDRLGLTTEVNTVLTATRLIPPARPDADTLIRPLTGDEDWAQAKELRFATEDGGVPSAEHRQFLEGKLAEYRRLCEAGHLTWFGAFVDGRMRAGAGLCADGGGLARFQNVETHPGYRRRGLASALVHHIGDWGLRELGARTLVIVADPDYHAIRIYRALGFADTEKQVQLHRPPVPGGDVEA
ncbi:GNAT family N-acetyltransferase [Streptomyces palmae]|uniref:GNAT family N-acetyltransferase n=1 Tax=Streptomyces palmae TaxID=1701085 RepID=A0A4Z0HDC9_9ACTN|nr:GNAT family N-acetyltransferase [Streptomyces palmae]TGB15594.1 GNAT family N-acetyltransferase [Streptomyces palmae]